MWNGNIPCMLKDLHGTSDANKETLCLSSDLYVIISL